MVNKSYEVLIAAAERAERAAAELLDMAKRYRDEADSLSVGEGYMIASPEEVDRQC